MGSARGGAVRTTGGASAGPAARGVRRCALRAGQSGAMVGRRRRGRPALHFTQVYEYLRADGRNGGGTRRAPERGADGGEARVVGGSEACPALVVCCDRLRVIFSIALVEGSRRSYMTQQKESVVTAQRFDSGMTWAQYL